VKKGYRNLVANNCLKDSRRTSGGQNKLKLNRTYELWIVLNWLSVGLNSGLL
jgi:hypothetical protein